MSARARLDDARFPIVAMIEEADGQAARAVLVLRTPDAVLLGHGPAIQDACLAAGFGLGAQYVAVRIALLSAVRDRQGLIPAEYERNAETWRRGLVAFAAQAEGAHG